MTESESSVIRCWKCGKEISVVRNQAAKDVQCPYCESSVSVPPQAFGARPEARAIGPIQPSVAHKSPAAAAVLNFLFWGAGYIYAGRGWGWAILIPYILLSLMGLGAMAEMSGEDWLIGTIISLPIDIVLAWHAHQMIKEGQSRNTL